MPIIMFYKGNKANKGFTLDGKTIIADFMKSPEYQTYQESRNFLMSVCCFMAKYGSYDIFEDGEIDDLYDIMRDIERSK